MFRKFAAAILSILLLSVGWLGLTGMLLPVAFVPLLAIAAQYGPSRRDWWRMFGWACLVFVGWNAATVWWIWYATPVGPVAATLATTTLDMLAFMLFFTVSKRAPKSLAYTTLVAAWIATEYWYTVGDFSWPWLVLGNGFSHDLWAVQWYEYTGVFGGSLWVLVCNLCIYEAWRARRSVGRWTVAAAAVVVPLLLSAVTGRAARRAETAPDLPTAVVSVIQPNVPCYEKFDGDNLAQERNILALLSEVPADADFILLPETAVPGYYWEPALSEHPSTGPQPSGRLDTVRSGAFWRALRDSLRASHPGALLLAGTNTQRLYAAGGQTRTARPLGGFYYDHFNTAAGLDAEGGLQLHHKGRLVIGVENTPTAVFDLLDFLVIDLGGVLGQIGIGQSTEAFTHRGTAIGPAICYEGLYGDFYGGFVRDGARLMAIISNDGWWGDTPGYRHLFSISRLRAVEHRRSVARAANTGRSGFILPSGRVGETLGWAQRGVLTARLPLVDRPTFYTLSGDYIGRIAEYVLLLSVLYFVAYRVRRRNHLVQ